MSFARFSSVILQPNASAAAVGAAVASFRVARLDCRRLATVPHRLPVSPPRLLLLRCSSSSSLSSSSSPLPPPPSSPSPPPLPSSTTQPRKMDSPLFDYNKLDVSPRGNIQLIFGPMFSGKTTELLRRIKRFSIARRRCLVIKYAKDTRYSEDGVSTHDR